MGAKQSKRSVDISGKEAESGGEVAAAGAVVEGRVEALADGDALKPQLNGDAHIHELTDKEKQLDSGTTENEKDATTEKEGKEQENEGEKEKEAAAVTNGDSDAKTENGESSPAPAAEDGKKPKKEKVKKKWSLRSISFSRKDKPKQEKKQKEEEAKTNGEPEKVPEEAAEATPETAANEVAEEAKPEVEADVKTPDTPVTEPLTNGSSTPEAPAPTPAPAQPAVPASSPEQLPLNGLSLEDTKPEAPVAETKEESKLEEQPTAETAPAPEIPVIKEVCVEQMPLETPPPPLPANPPPSSVASFAASTMAPELPAPPAELAPPAHLNHTEIAATVENQPDAVTDCGESELPAPVKDEIEIEVPLPKEIELELPAPVDELNSELPASINEAKSLPAPLDESVPELSAPVNDILPAAVNEREILAPLNDIEQELPAPVTDIEPELPAPVRDIESEITAPITDESVLPAPLMETLQSDLPTPPMELVNVKPEELEEKNAQQTAIGFTASLKENVLESDLNTEVSNPKEDITQGQGDQNEVGIVQLAEDSKLLASLDPSDNLPPPPPLDENDEVTEHNLDGLSNGKPEAEETQENIVNSNHISESVDVDCVITENINGNMNTEEENLKNKMKDTLGNVVGKVECNGNANAEPAAASSQEPLPVSDKLSDLIPDVPVVPELKTETEAARELALAE